MTLIRFTVPGTPAQKGSGNRMPNGGWKPEDKNLEPWTKVVKAAARQAYRGEPIEDWVIVKVSFFWPFFKFGNPAINAPLEKAIELHGYPDPDQDKTCRALNDALKKAGILKDDKQVLANIPAIGQSCKYWACESHPPGAIIEIIEIKNIGDETKI